MPYTKTWRYLRHLLNYLHEMKEDIYIDYKVFFFSFIFHEVTMNYEFRKIYKKAGKFYMKYYTQDDYDFIKKEALKYLNHAAGLRHVQIGYDIISFFAPVDFIRKDKQLQERLFEIVEHVPNAFAAHCKLFYMIVPVIAVKIETILQNLTPSVHYHSHKFRRYTSFVNRLFIAKLHILL
jgi:hypothetical protein